MTIIEKHGHRRSERASVWFAIPSARPTAEAEKCLKEWTERGYRTAIWTDIDRGRHGDTIPLAALNVVGMYPGYAAAVNGLVARVIEHDPGCDWIVTGGDDTFPHPDKSAAEIAEECNEHFAEYWSDHYNWKAGRVPAWAPTTTAAAETFGVMQPTGDRWAGGHIDRIAGSPWMGREWCLRANGGRGPLWPEFTHMFGDEALKRTAEKVGVYWMRPDLTHFHRHFKRTSDHPHADAANLPVPPHLVKWNTREHWDEMKSIFKRLEREDFAPCMPK